MKAYARIDTASLKVRLMEVPVPEIKAEEVLIDVKAFGVGIHDRYFIPPDVVFPYVIGTEGAGTITKTGSSVADFKIGDRVIFTTILRPHGGSWAEYAVTNQSALKVLPDKLTFSEGAAIPIAGGTALECMRSLNLNKGDKLFIAGASGAIGTIVIQLAVARGIRVSASASEKNHDYMKSLGEVETVDYNDPDWKSKIKEWSDGGVDAALAIQPGTAIECIEVVRNGGKLITVSGDNDQVAPVREISVKQIGHHTDTQKKVIELINSISTGEIHIEIEKEYPFENAIEALEKTETRHARGKLVVKGFNL